MAQSDFLQLCELRGFLHQCTDTEGLDALLKRGTFPVYIGFDCTAPTLHVGSLVQIMLLRWLQHYGYQPIILLGAATTRVGDPSGKDETRKLLTDKEIQHNLTQIEQLFSRFVRLGKGKLDALCISNDTWLDKVRYIDFLRDVGRHFSINRMLTFDSVKLRLEREQHLSFLEFNYMLLQAYDFVELYRQYGCRLQIGGADQWGNIVSGIELNRRMDGKEELYGMTTPLITTAGGAKMGKTAKGAVWLTAQDFSGYDYWQFWRNTDDKDVGRFLRLFTELPLEEITKLEKLAGNEINEAKKVLATEATSLCHGRQVAIEAQTTAQQTFEEGGVGKALPEITVAMQELHAGIPAFRLFHMAGLAESGGDAKRLLKGGGGKMNDDIIQDPMLLILPQHVTREHTIKLSSGKKKHAVVKIV